MQTLSSSTRVRHKPTAVQGITYSLTTKGKKSFEVRYTDPASGKQRYEKVGTFEQAKARLREVQHKHVKGEVVGDPTITVSELIERWREGRAAVKPKTARIYDDYIRLHIEPRWGKVRVREVQRAGISAWLSGLKRQDGKGELSGTTKLLVLSTLSVVLDYGIECDLISVNPCRSLPRRSKPRPVKLEARILQPGEMEALLAASSEWLRDVIRLTYYGALRMGEVCGLQWGDVDFERNVLVIQRQLSPNMEFGTPKGGKSAEVPMVPELRRLLAAKKLAAGAVTPAAPVLPAVTYGGWMNPATVGHSFNEARKKAGLSTEPRPFRFHDLRHSAISQLANAPGAVLPQVQAFARHATLVTTMGYIHRVENETWVEQAGSALAGFGS
jgi:integrase